MADQTGCDASPRSCGPTSRSAPLLSALTAFLAVCLLTCFLGCVIWWGVQYLMGVRTPRGDFAVSIPLPVAGLMGLACIVLGALAARAAFARASRALKAEQRPG